jgi:hypothetical protein
VAYILPLLSMHLPSAWVGILLRSSTHVFGYVSNLHFSCRRTTRIGRVRRLKICLQLAENEVFLWLYLIGSGSLPLAG